MVSLLCNINTATAVPLQAVFPSQALLHRHERESHLNLRPYTCAVCAARFDRISQLNYHQRRIHAEERGHACQICHKVRANGLL